MSSLLGAWSRTGEPVCSHINAADKRRMLAQLGPSVTVETLQSGALWCVAGTQNSARRLNDWVAMEGYLPLAQHRMSCLQRLLSDPKMQQRPPEGHYVLAHAHSNGLTLLRALSGGERMYYLSTPQLVLFAASIRPLLAFQQQRQFNSTKRQDAILTGLTLFGPQTLAYGIDEVAAGQSVHFQGSERHQDWHWGGLLHPKQGARHTLARDFRSALGHAVQQSIGDQKTVAVALSGGIDSAAVIALAVEALGADQVVAFTYEFDDPAHPSETAYATAVCRQLGIRRHEVFKITLQDFLAAIPETVWRAESATHWPKAFMLPVTRHIRDAGFDQYLCGFGIGSHMSFLEEFSRLLHWLPATEHWLPFWKWCQFGRFQGHRLEHLHPSLAPVNRRLYYFLLSLLQTKGMVPDLSRFYPKQIHALLQTIAQPCNPDAEFSDMPLTDLFRHQSFAHLISCVDVTRWEKTTRELGAQRVSPAHFATCLPYAYLPYKPQPFVWHPSRRLRPGKHLLRLAMQGSVPDCVLQRKKSWADAVISPHWLQAGVRWMQSVLPESFDWLAADCRESCHYWDKRSPQAAVTAIRFWHKIFIEREPSAQPPCWRDLFD